MSKSSQPQRTVRDIKTLAGKAEDLHTPHKMYMRLFALETERHRRMQERASAMVRIANIDARCAEIDAEKEVLLDLLGVEAIPTDFRPGAGTGSGTCAPRAVPRPDPRRARVRTEAPAAAAEPVYEPVRIRY